MANSLRIAVTPFVVPAGAQGLNCQTIANPFGGAVDVIGWSTDLGEGGHHLHVYQTDAATDVAPHDCTQNLRDNLVFQSQAIGTSSMVYPSGISAHFDPGQGVTVRVHYLNLTDHDITVAPILEARLATPETTSTRVAPLRFDNTNILIPPHSTSTTVTKTCHVLRDIDLVWLTSHAHTHITDFRATLGGETLFTSHTFAEPITTVYDPPRAIAAGQAITFSCTYANTTDSPITFGDRLESDEMCNLVGAYVTPNFDGSLITCDEPTTGCQTCVQALAGGDPTRLCTSDGPPSSRERYDAFNACSCGASSSCASACAATACAGQRPDTTCQNCLSAHCAAERTACLGA
jgi:hypothetical protein